MESGERYRSKWLTLLRTLCGHSLWPYAVLASSLAVASTAQSTEHNCKQQTHRTRSLGRNECVATDAIYSIRQIWITKTIEAIACASHAAENNLHWKMKIGIFKTQKIRTWATGNQFEKQSNQLKNRAWNFDVCIWKNSVQKCTFASSIVRPRNAIWLWWNIPCKLHHVGITRVQQSLMRTADTATCNKFDLNNCLSFNK